MKKFLVGFFGFLLAAAGVVWAAVRRMQMQSERDMQDLLANTRRGTAEIVRPEQLESLPAPVRRYLIYTGVVGKPIPQAVRVRQRGQIRPAKGQPWLPFSAEEVYTVDPPGFVWKVLAQAGPLPVPGRDQYRYGAGRMQICPLGLFSAVDASGPELDQGAMMRFFNEIIWFPGAFLKENITWREIDDLSAEATFTDSGKSISAVLQFDASGRVLNFIAQRYMFGDDGGSLQTWSTPIATYGKLGGLRLPLTGSAVWNLPDGDFEYIQLEITDVEYDPPGDVQ
jgi:hypothetical protein